MKTTQLLHNLGQFGKAGIDVHILADRIQNEGAKVFCNSWNELMEAIGSKSIAPEKAG